MQRFVCSEPHIYINMHWNVSCQVSTVCSTCKRFWMFDFEVTFEAKKQVSHLTEEKNLVSNQDWKTGQLDLCIQDLRAGRIQVKSSGFSAFQMHSGMSADIIPHFSSKLVTTSIWQHRKPFLKLAQTVQFPPDCYDQTPLLAQQLLLTNK